MWRSAGVILIGVLLVIAGGVLFVAGTGMLHMLGWLPKYFWLAGVFAVIATASLIPALTAWFRKLKNASPEEHKRSLIYIELVFLPISFIFFVGLIRLVSPELQVNYVAIGLWAVGFALGNRLLRYIQRKTREANGLQ